MKIAKLALLLLTVLPSVSAFAQNHEFYKFRALGEQAVSSVLEATSNTYWITTYDGILRIDLDSDSLFSIKPDDGGQGHAFTDLTKDPRGQLWITGRNALVRFDGERWYRVPLKKETDLLVGLASDSKGNIWVAGGLGKLDPLVLKLSGRRATHFGVAHGLIQGRISALLVDRLDQVWTATEFGLNVFDGQSWDVVEADEAGKHLSRMTDLYQGKDEQIWAASAFGEVFEIDPRRQSAREIRPVPPLEELYHVASFEGEVWVASKHSLARLKGGKWKRVSVFAPNSEAEFLDMSFSRDGRLLLGTTKGLVVRDRE